jgi:DNA-binding NtrC family response regulator
LPYAPRILIVDDDAQVRDLFTRIIAEDGYFVNAVATARHARMVLRDREVDVVILDLSLPDADGLDLVREIRSDYPYVKILAISGYMTERTMKASAISAGATATLPKPTTPRKLRDSVFRLLDASRSWAGSG